MFLKKILALKFTFMAAFVFSQTKNDTLDGALLTNFKKSDPIKVYKYQLSSTAYAFLKFDKGQIVQVDFLPAIDSIRFLKVKNKYATFTSFRSKNKSTAYSNVQIYEKGGFFIFVDFVLLEEEEWSNYNHFSYYDNGYLSETNIVNGSAKQRCLSSYYSSGIKSKEEFRDSTNKAYEVKVYRKNSTLEYRSITSEKLVVREFYSEQGGLTSIDSLDLNSKNIGSTVTYYPNKVIRGVMPYKNGSIDGVLEIFYPSGQPKSKERFKDGLSTGEFILYRKDGSIKKSKGNW